MFQSDFHLHSNHSFDSKTTMADICQQAVDKNFNEVCFAEHFSIDPHVPTYGHIKWDIYQADILQNRAKFSGMLDIRKGIEICEPHHDVKRYRQILAKESMDVILGSVHNVNGRKLRFLLRDFGRDHCYKAFFDETLSMVQTADIDCVAHLDLIKRYSGEAFSDQDLDLCRKEIENILLTIIDRRLVLEINTSTLKSLKQTMPCENILQLYRNLGGTRISFGSDSHSGSGIGQDFDLARRIAVKCGFSSYCTFENRTVSQRLIELQ